MKNIPLMTNYHYFDDRFRSLVLQIAQMERIYNDCRWTEGPVWFSDANYLVWSDIPNDRLMRWVPGLGVDIFRAPSNHANGNTRDNHGRLITCEHSGRRVTRTEPDGSITVIADVINGGRLNSPNDVVVKSDGSVWFSDPDYGIMSDYEGKKGEREQSGCHVYRVDGATGEVTVVADDFDRPNGLAFSTDESILYVSDTGGSHTPDGPAHIRAFEVSEGKKLRKSRIFCTPEQGFSDGFRLDMGGNVWTSAGAGVNCYAQNGDRLGRIDFPNVVSNLVFGGSRRNRLFVTCGHEIFSLYVAANGCV